jgi:hypothetical protein
MQDQFCKIFTLVYVYFRAALLSEGPKDAELVEDVFATQDERVRRQRFEAYHAVLCVCVRVRVCARARERARAKVRTSISRSPLSLSLSLYPLFLFSFSLSQYTHVSSIIARSEKGKNRTTPEVYRA